MKTKAIRPGNLLFLLGALALAGCNSSSADSAPAAAAPTAYQPAPELRQAQPTPAAPEAAPLPIAEANLDFTPSPNLADLIKLARSGVSESLMLKFIQNTSGGFGLGAAEIIYLNDLGVSETIINTIMERDRAYATAPQAAPTAPAPAPAPVVVVEQQPAVIVEPAPVTVNYFNETLSPYGTWVEVDGYGRCWQPTVIAYQTDWQPYRDRGRWIYSDCGWYWASDYSWGNVAFHYGRWFRDSRRGWCWSPDTIWAPAWVSWRNNNDYCGWAPLPPAAHYHPGIGFTYYDRNVGFSFDFGLRSDCYTFVSRNRFTDSHLRSHTRPHHEVTQIFNTTTVNNHYSDGGRSGRVFNHGIEPAAITAGTPNQIRPIRAPAPATPTVRTPSTGRSHGNGSGRDHANTASTGRNSTPPSHNPAPGVSTSPSRPTQPPIATTSPAVVPSMNRPTLTDRGNGIGRDRGNSTPKDRDFVSRPRNPVQTQPARIVTPSAPRPTPMPAPERIVAPPTIRTPVVTARPVTVPPVNRPTSTDRRIGNGRDQGNSSSRDYNPSFRAPSHAPVAIPSITRPTPAPARPQPTISPRVAPSMPIRSPMPIMTAPAPVRSQPAAPSYTPRPAPAQPATRAPSVQHIESRPAPAASPAPARNESRPNSDREKRSR